MSEPKERLAVLAGAALLSVVGRDRFYQLAQDRSGLLGRIAAAFCQGHAGRVGENYAIFRDNKDRERMTDVARRFYSDESLHGFGDAELTRPDAKRPLLEQSRGRVIPLVLDAIKSGATSVLEIGTGNGDVIAWLANECPDVWFTGVDLFTNNASLRHRLNNLRFETGYALDLLRDDSIGGDVVFASSTFCIFAPKELCAYLDVIKATRLILSDPITFGNVHTRNPKPRSRHMDLYMWWHNYYGYLTQRGWTIDHFETVPHSYPHNPNAKFVVLSASR